MKRNDAKWLVGLTLLTLAALALLKVRARNIAQASPQTPTKIAAPLSTEVVLGKPFFVALQKSTTLPDELKVTFVRVVEDSRCPQDVDCVWSGQATVLVRLEKAGRKLGDVELTVQGSNYVSEMSIREIKPYWIKLIEVAPERGSHNSPGAIQRINLLVQNKPIPNPKNGK